MARPIISHEDIYKLCPNAKQGIVSAVVHYQDLLDQHGINTPLRLAHFMAQLAQESDGFRTTREYASGQAYEGREDLGNTEKGDGRRFRGRGLIQITGRFNARRYGQILGMPFESDPELMESFPAALEVSCLYWRETNCGRAADRDDCETVTRIINGGLTHYDRRLKYLAKAKEIWGTPRTLRRGDKSQDVWSLQVALDKAGFRAPVDETLIFGPGTEKMVKKFQAEHGLVVDGIVGPKTWTELSRVSLR